MNRFKASFSQSIPSHQTIVLPISMNQPLERGERLESILRALIDNNHLQNTTVLVCDYLNRHNCDSIDEAIHMGDEFIKDHASFLKPFKILRWKEFLDEQGDVFTHKHQLIKEKGEEGTRFYNKMKKTWEKCLSANQTLEASIQYQMEEYAAILCMNEFEHLIYPKRITNGMAYLYNFISGYKPIYHHIKISEFKENKPTDSASHNHTHTQKERRHIHIAFRGLLEHMETLLSSGELSDKAKRMFAEEVDTTLMAFGLKIDEDTSSDEVSGTVNG